MNDRAKTVQIPVQRPRPQLPPNPPPRGRATQRRLILLSGLGVMALVVVGGSIYLAMESDGEPTAEQAELGAFRGHAAKVSAMAISTDGEKVVSGDEAGKVLVWNTSTREQLFELAPAAKPITSLAISLDGDWAAAGDEQGAVRVWNLKQKALKVEFPAHGAAVAALVFYPTGKMLITGGRDGRLALWDIDDRKQLAERSLERAELAALSATPDGLRVITGDSFGKVRVWNTADLRELHAFDAHKGEVASVVVSPRGGQALSAGKDGSLRRWDLENMQAMGTLPNPAGEAIDSIAYSPGATRALTIGDRGGRVWSLEDDRLVESFSGSSGPKSCGLFHPAGTYLVAGSSDPAIRLWRTTLPSEIELKRARETEAGFKAMADKLRRFAEQIRLAREYFDDHREKEAVAEFQRAAAGFPRDSLEFKLADGMAVELDRNITALERYAELCKLGKGALEKKDFPQAIEHFQKADLELRNVKDAAKYTESTEGLKAAMRFQTLRTALDGLRATGESLEFATLAGPKPLEEGRKFAFLLVKELPPMALATTPLAYTVGFSTEIEFPEEDIKLRVQLFEEASRKLVAESIHPFESGTKIQKFGGKLAPPVDGWKSGSYELRSALLVKDEERELSKKSFKFGRIDWTETNLELTPSEVQKLEYVVKTEIEVERGDLLKVTAQGTVRPAALAFYREFMADQLVSTAIPSPPEGLKWRLDHLRINKYRTVDLKSDFAALIMRIGYDGKWLPYQVSTPTVPAPTKGKLQFSINSILPKDFSYAGKNKPLTSLDRSYWAADSGAYHVTVLHGRYDFPDALTDLQRGGLTTTYFGDLKSPKAP